MDFDFDALDTKTPSENGVDMPLRDLKGEPMTDKTGKPVLIRLRGPDSDTYRRMTRHQVRKRLDRAAKGVTLDDDAEAAQNETDAIDIMAACTVSWQGINDKAGQPIACTPENAVELYRRYPTVRDQVDLFVSSRANFSPVSSKR